MYKETVQETITIFTTQQYNRYQEETDYQAPTSEQKQIY